MLIDVHFLLRKVYILGYLGHEPGVQSFQKTKIMKF